MISALVFLHTLIWCYLCIGITPAYIETAKDYEEDTTYGELFIVWIILLAWPVIVPLAMIEYAVSGDDER